MKLARGAKDEEHMSQQINVRGLLSESISVRTQSTLLVRAAAERLFCGNSLMKR